MTSFPLEWFRSLFIAYNPLKPSLLTTEQIFLKAYCLTYITKYGNIKYTYARKLFYKYKYCFIISKTKIKMEVQP